MRLWFSPASEVPIYRQLVTQVALAILSGDLKPGDRLPSTRELARRFSIHPNTVSAGYRQLAREGWVEYRHGSGVYIKDDAIPPSTPEQILDQHIAAFFRAVRELQLPAAAIRQRVAEWIASPAPDHFLLIESDADAREILLTEIRQLTHWPAVGVSVEDTNNPEAILGAVPLCLQAPRVRKREFVLSLLRWYRTHSTADSIGEQMARSGATYAHGKADRGGFALERFSGDCRNHAGSRRN